jgi:hypothetical protein
MKTKIKNPKINLNRLFFILVVAFLLPYGEAFSQENDSTQMLFRSKVRVTELWTPEVKVNSIQGEIGSLVGFYGGAVFNRVLLLGISGGVNLSHPRVNYGYFGVMAQYIYKPANLVHCSFQVSVASGSTKDYEHTKTGLFDNFWNISGAAFYMMEPGINIEMNLANNMTLVSGISYRYVTGLNGKDENVSLTHLTNNDLSGLNISIGVKFGKVRAKGASPK